MDDALDRRADSAEVARRAIAQLRCPRCRAELTAEDSSLRCEQCSGSFRIEDGVVRLCDEDDFYEGAYQGTTNFLPSNGALSLAALYLLNVHYLWEVRRFVPEGAALLELGCGGGIRYFAERTDASGLDLSFASVRSLDGSYGLALQGDALDMPIQDARYDAVVSAFFYEHIAPEYKDQLLAETYRVLKPGGHAILLFDVESHNPLFRYFRRDPAKYQECFVEHDHHYGLEPATTALERFRNAGFRVRYRHLANKTPVQHLPVYGWAEPYGRPPLRAAAKVAAAISKNRPAAFAYTFGLTIADDLLEPWLPKNWSRLMLAVIEKPA